MWLFEQLLGLLMFVVMLVLAAAGILLVVAFVTSAVSAGGIVDELPDLAPVILGTEHPWFEYQMENDQANEGQVSAVRNPDWTPPVVSPPVVTTRPMPPMPPVNGHPPPMTGRD
jgi:hypothetical protein